LAAVVKGVYFHQQVLQPIGVRHWLTCSPSADWRERIFSELGKQQADWAGDYEDLWTLNPGPWTLNPEPWTSGPLDPET